MKNIIFSLFFLLISFFAGANVPSESLYHLQHKWTNSDGEKVKLEDFKGQVLALAIVYTRCDYSCPLMIEELKKIKAQVSAAAASKTKYVLVSMDPKNDTPQVLKEFKKKKNLGSEWVLLTAENDEPVRDLAVILGVNIKKIGKEFAHSNLITVVGPEGVVGFSKPRIGQQIEETAQTMAKLAGTKK